MNQQETKKIIDIAIKNFRGLFPTLEGAIGSLIVGQKMGWKILYLVHDKRTIQKYESVLNIKFREVLPEVGPLAHKSVAWVAMERISNFWKAVKGEISIPHRQDLS